MKRNRQLEIGITLVLAFILMACGASARQTTIRATYESLAVADDSLKAFSATQEQAIVDKALARQATKAEVTAELAAFRLKMDKANNDLNAAFRMVFGAQILDDERSLAAALKVAGLVITQLKEIGVLK